MQEKWLTYARRLESIASSGAHFGASDFDRERYTELADIARNMMADLSGQSVERVTGLMAGFGEGYRTPYIDVRGAVIRAGKILLVREKLDGLWSMPGGYADVGWSAAENVLKEIREEAGITAQVIRLYAVKHKAKHDYTPDLRDFYKFFFLCDCPGDAQAQAGSEATAVGFFAPDELPPLSLSRITPCDITEAFAALHASSPTVFID